MGKRKAGVKYLVVALFMLFANPVCAAERGYSVTDFDSIRVIGPFTVDVVTGKGAAARASGTADALERVNVSVQGRLLTIRSNSAAWGGSQQKAYGPAKIRITVPQLRSASIDGAGQMSISSMKGMRLSLYLQGSSTLTVGRIETDKLIVDLAGSGKISVAGSVKALQASGSGSVTFEARNLVASDALFNWISSGNAEFAAIRTAKITSTGSGTVRVSGKPACTVTALGAGEVICGDASNK